MDEDDERQWVVHRSQLDRATWVPIPYGFGDQTFAFHCGPKRRVMAWVEEQAGVSRDDMGQVWRWVREDADRMLLTFIV